MVVARTDVRGDQTTEVHGQQSTHHGQTPELRQPLGRRPDVRPPVLLDRHRAKPRVALVKPDLDMSQRSRASTCSSARRTPSRYDQFGKCGMTADERNRSNSASRSARVDADSPDVGTGRNSTSSDAATIHAGSAKCLAETSTRAKWRAYSASAARFAPSPGPARGSSHADLR